MRFPPRVKEFCLFFDQPQGESARQAASGSSPLRLPSICMNQAAPTLALCERLGDYVSREMLRVQLSDTEEDHTYWLEQQLSIIQRIGMERYQLSKLDAKSPA